MVWLCFCFFFFFIGKCFDARKILFLWRQRISTVACYWICVDFCSVFLAVFLSLSVSAYSDTVKIYNKRTSALGFAFADTCWRSYNNSPTTFDVPWLGYLYTNCKCCLWMKNRFRKKIAVIFVVVFYFSNERLKMYQKFIKPVINGGFIFLFWGPFDEIFLRIDILTPRWIFYQKIISI